MNTNWQKEESLDFWNDRNLKLTIWLPCRHIAIQDVLVAPGRRESDFEPMAQAGSCCSETLDYIFVIVKS